MADEKEFKDKSKHSTAKTGKEKTEKKPQDQPRKPRKKNAPDRPQPSWLFPPVEANPVLNPKPKSEEQLRTAKEAREASVNFLKHRAHNAPVRPAPPTNLLILVAIFLTEWGFDGASRLYTAQCQNRRKLDDWDYKPGMKLEAGIPKLDKIYKEWHKEWQEKREVDMTSSDEDSSSESDATTKRDKKVKKKKARSSSSSSASSSESDATTKRDKKVKKKKAKFSSSSSASSSESDADSEDESRVVSSKNEPLPDKKPAATKVPASSGIPGNLSSDSSATLLAPESKEASISSVSSTSDVSTTSSSSDSETSSVKQAVQVKKKKTQTKSKRSASPAAPNKPLATVEAPIQKSKAKESEPPKSADNAQPNEPSKRKRSASPVPTNTPSLTADTPVKKHKVQNAPFSRIPKDVVVDERLSSNAYQPYDYADKAHRDLIVNKGKNFTKEKNKKKRGSYRGGAIDVDGKKGIKFDD